MCLVHTFSHIIVHHEFQVFTAPDHSYRMPLVVIQLLAGVQSLGALAWEWWLVSLDSLSVTLQTQYLLCFHVWLVKCTHIHVPWTESRWPWLNCHINAFNPTKSNSNSSSNLILVGQNYILLHIRKNMVLVKTILYHVFSSKQRLGLPITW